MNASDDTRLARLEQLERDFKDAAGDLPVPLPEPGTDMAKLVAANALLRREKERVRNDVEKARRMVAAQVIESLMPVGPLTNKVPSRYLALVEEHISEDFGLTEEDIEETFKIESERRDARQRLLDTLRRAEAERDQARTNLAEASKMWDGPETQDWFEGVRKEAAHQVGRWGTAHDEGKSPFDWFWLIGYLAQKAASSAVAGDMEKARHHTISTGAALLNWHARMLGLAQQFRPGIEPPEEGAPQT